MHDVHWSGTGDRGDFGAGVERRRLSAAGNALSVRQEPRVEVLRLSLSDRLRMTGVVAIGRGGAVLIVDIARRSVLRLSLV